MNPRLDATASDRQSRVTLEARGYAARAPHQLRPFVVLDTKADEWSTTAYVTLEAAEGYVGAILVACRNARGLVEPQPPAPGTAQEMTPSEQIHQAGVAEGRLQVLGALSRFLDELESRGDLASDAGMILETWIEGEVILSKGKPESGGAA